MRQELAALALILAFGAFQEDLEFFWRAYGPGDCITDLECELKHGPDEGEEPPCTDLRPDDEDYCEECPSCEAR